MTTSAKPRHRTSLRKGPTCGICRHPSRVLIEQTRIAGASLDTIAKKYGVSRDSIHRHCSRHIPDDLKASYLAGIPLKDLAAKAASEGISVLEYLSLVRATLMTEFQLAAAVHDRHATGALAGRLTEVLRAIGSISGELGSMATSLTINNVSIMNNPMLANLQANMLRALAPYPDARAAVIGALRQMDAAPVEDAPKLLELEAVNV